MEMHRIASCNTTSCHKCSILDCYQSIRELWTRWRWCSQFSLLFFLREYGHFIVYTAASLGYTFIILKVWTLKFVQSDRHGEKKDIMTVKSLVLSGGVWGVVVVGFAVSINNSRPRTKSSHAANMPHLDWHPIIISPTHRVCTQMHLELVGHWGMKEH